MRRRLLLALLLAGSMTLSGASSCSNPAGPCHKVGEWCGPDSCCSGLHCVYARTVNEYQSTCQPPTPD